MKLSKVGDVKTPTRGTSKSAGIDFYIPNDFKETFLKPKESIKIFSKIYVKLPENTMLCAKNKSSIADKGLIVGACVVDEDYQGEIILHLINVSDYSVKLTPGQKIIQMVLMPVIYDFEEVPFEDLYDGVTERGIGAFGSTN